MSGSDASRRADRKIIEKSILFGGAIILAFAGLLGMESFQKWKPEDPCDEAWYRKYGMQVSRPAPEASVVGSLRTLNTAEATYASTYPDLGFSRNLAALKSQPDGVPPSRDAAGLIDPYLASGRKYEYMFSYRPASPETQGFIQSYQIVARPVNRKYPTCRCFYTDQSGVIRATRDNREANVQDAPIQ